MSFFGSGPSFQHRVGLGDAAGWTINTKFGNNPDIDTATAPEDIWNGGGTYTGQPTGGSAETVDVYSDDVSDTAAGTGARTIRIEGLDENWAAQTEDITMNGTTPVTSTGQWFRVFRAYVLTAGSSEANEGTITVEHTTTSANVFVQMSELAGQTLICAFTVPANMEVLIWEAAASMSRSGGLDGSGHVSLRTRGFEGAWTARRYSQLTTQGASPIIMGGGILLSEKTDVKVRVEDVSDNNTAVSASLTYYTRTA